MVMNVMITISESLIEALTFMAKQLTRSITS